MGAQRGDAATTGQATLAAARELFAAHGVDGVSVRDIAAAIGLPPAPPAAAHTTSDQTGGPEE